MKHKQKLPASTISVPSNAGRRKTSTVNTLSKSSSKPPIARRGFRQDRCEVTRSAGYDPTGERAIECGAPAQLMCELCGPMCGECAETTFCVRGEHRLIPIGDEPGDKSRGGTARSKRLRGVAILQMNCRRCGTLRLLWPCDPGHQPAINRQCPGCKRRLQAVVLGYGWTRIRLPYFERVDELLNLYTSHRLERRIPWDRLGPRRDSED